MLLDFCHAAAAALIRLWYIPTEPPLLYVSLRFVALQPVSYGSTGVQFCEPNDATRSQLYGDPNNNTYAVIHDLMHEMSSLFEDNVFNIGCDETGVKGPCTLESTFALERRVFNAIAQELKKTPEGWEVRILAHSFASARITVAHTSWLQMKS